MFLSKSEQFVEAFTPDGAVRRFTLPHPNAEVVSGVAWGRIESAMTPAFWATQCWFAEHDGAHAPAPLTSTIVDEVAACLLGGYGMPAELGWAAYERLRDSGILRLAPTAEQIAAVLAQPLVVGDRRLRYRFVGQKSRYLSQTLRSLAERPIRDFSSGRALRSRLIECDGIGPKTASWVARNWLGADDVAILDVHVVRACGRIGVMPADANPARDYMVLEERFLAFAAALGARASVLDAIIWQTMRELGSLRFA